MLIHILKETPNELRIDIAGEGHTFCNVLQKTILEDGNVEVAGYDIPHPLTSNPIVFIRTKGDRKPETVLREAVEKLRERNEEFRKAFEEAVKKFDSK